MQHGPVLVESYSRTRWLDKLRPAGTPHRWMGQGARWHLSWPLADTTAQKMTTFLDSCTSILAPVHAILLCIIQARNSSNYVRHPYARGLALQCSCRREDLHTQTLSEKRVETGKSSGPCTVEIPVQSTAREFHTSLPYRRTSPLVNNFLNPAIHSSKLHTQKKKRHVISGAMLLKKKKTQYVLFL